MITTKLNNEVIRKYNFKSDVLNKGQILWGEGITSTKPHKKVILKYNMMTQHLDMFYPESTISALNSGYIHNDKIFNYERKFLILHS